MLLVNTCTVYGVISQSDTDYTLLCRIVHVPLRTPYTVDAAVGEDGSIGLDGEEEGGSEGELIEEEEEEEGENDLVVLDPSHVSQTTC